MEMAQTLSPINFIGKYIWAMSNADLDTAKKLELTSIKKYWRRARQVEIKLNWLYNRISILATFVRYSNKIYNNEEVTKNMNIS